MNEAFPALTLGKMDDEEGAAVALETSGGGGGLWVLGGGCVRLSGGIWLELGVGIGFDGGGGSCIFFTFFAPKFRALSLSLSISLVWVFSV